MSYILYYSRNCTHSAQLLGKLAGRTGDEVHYICIDKRETAPTGATHVVLDNGEKVQLPPGVNRVPALLQLNRGNQLLFGGDIAKELNVGTAPGVPAACVPDEPAPFTFGGGGGCGIASDTFSFLDQSETDMAAKGDGGMRQLH